MNHHAYERVIHEMEDEHVWAEDITGLMCPKCRSGYVHLLCRSTEGGPEVVGQGCKSCGHEWRS